MAADYQAGLPVAVISEKHQIGLTPMYRILTDRGSRGVRPTPGVGQTPNANAVSDFGSHRPSRRPRLIQVDEATLVVDYQAGLVTVDALCETYGIGLVRLYRILDRHRIPRRRPQAPKLDGRLSPGEILIDYERGDAVETIAGRHGVSESTVSNVAYRHGLARPAGP